MTESKIPQRKQTEESNREAEDMKSRGNQALKAQEFKEAINYYGKAIELDPTNHVYYSNRAAAYLKLTKYNEALIDANKCIELREAWARGYGRKGAALFGLKRYSEAIEAYQSALRFEPNAFYKSEIESCKRSQKGKSKISSSISIKSIMSYVIYFGQLIGHIFLIISAVMSLFPLGGNGAYRRTLFTAAILQAVFVGQKHGIPKFEKTYWMELVQNNEVHFIPAALFCLMKRPFFLGVAGHVMRSALFLSTGMQDLIVRGPRILSPLNTPVIMDNLKKLTDMRYTIHDLVAMMEIGIGFMLIIEMLTPSRNPFLLFIWWQYLRIRYALSSYTMGAFAKLRHWLDKQLLYSSWCPSIIGSIYTKIKSFCVRVASPEAQSSRCSVM